MISAEVLYLLLLPVGLLALHFFINTLKMYYRLYFYTSQGVPYIYFPWPILGTNPQWIRDLPKNSLEHPMVDLFRYKYSDKPPKIMCDFRIPVGMIVFTDPEYVNELYVTKNKYFDKGGRMKNQMYDLFGESILLDSSNDWHSQKRKHMGAAFYKDKMIRLLDTVCTMTYERIQKWKQNYV